MSGNVYIYIACMAVTTYLVRILPLTLIRKRIRNRFIRSFLYSVPYVTLAVMTCPAILDATQEPLAAALALVVAIVLAYFEKSLFLVSVCACATVFVAEWLMHMAL